MKKKPIYITEYEGKAFFTITKKNQKGDTLAKYTIDMREKTCGCPHYWIHRKKCKHIKQCEALIKDELI